MLYMYLCVIKLSIIYLSPTFLSLSVEFEGLLSTFSLPYPVPPSEDKKSLYIHINNN